MSALVVALLLAQSGKAPAPAKPPKPIAAKKTANPGVAYPIRSIRVNGARNFSAEGILQVAGLRVGDPVSADRFEAARTRLLETGVFEQAGYKYAPSADQVGYDAVFEVREITQLFPYRFEGLDKTPAELTAILKKNDPLFAERIPATEPFLKRYAATLERGLASEPLIGRTEPDPATGYVVVFRPARPDASIFQVTFRGNDVIPFQPLQRSMNAVAVGVTYKEERVRQLLDSAIRPLYEERGRLDVQFPKIGAEPSPENKGLNVWVEVAEGPSYVFGDVWFSESAQELGRVASLLPGDVANIARVEEAKVRLRDMYRRRGFLKAEVSYQRKPKKEGGTHKLDVAFDIQPGNPYKFGAVTFQGLDILTEPHVRKMWAMQSGDPYNAEYPDLFLTRIREDQLMEGLGVTKAIPKVDDAQRVVDVTLEFQGAPRALPEKKRGSFN